jgi:hypothetical protein
MVAGDTKRNMQAEVALEEFSARFVEVEEFKFAVEVALEQDLRPVLFNRSGTNQNGGAGRVASKAVSLRPAISPRFSRCVAVTGGDRARYDVGEGSD